MYICCEYAETVRDGCWEDEEIDHVVRDVRTRRDELDGAQRKERFDRRAETTHTSLILLPNRPVLVLLRIRSEKSNEVLFFLDEPAGCPCAS